MLIGNKCDMEDRVRLKSSLIGLCITMTLVVVDYDARTLPPDSMQAVTLAEGEKLAKKYNVPFFETSAKSNINVDDAFLDMTKRVKARLDVRTADARGRGGGGGGGGQAASGGGAVDVAGGSGGGKGKCCGK